MQPFDQTLTQLRVLFQVEVQGFYLLTILLLTRVRVIHCSLDLDRILLSHLIHARILRHSDAAVLCQTSDTGQY
jgi:hypothetical protein